MIDSAPYSSGPICCCHFFFFGLLLSSYIIYFSWQSSSYPSVRTRKGSKKHGSHLFHNMQNSLHLLFCIVEGGLLIRGSWETLEYFLKCKMSLMMKWKNREHSKISSYKTVYECVRWGISFHNPGYIFYIAKIIIWRLTASLIEQKRRPAAQAGPHLLSPAVRLFCKHDLWVFWEVQDEILKDGILS